MRRLKTTVRWAIPLLFAACVGHPARVPAPDAAPDAVQADPCCTLLPDVGGVQACMDARLAPCSIGDAYCPAPDGGYINIPVGRGCQ